ncbi:MAG TPA: IPT/TIG domain-containing protein [Pyrinomonadaceae bacterium]|nr:IPT/TIG domain-containing protein [Pyrinomonadaceae bacterium]
MILNDRSLDPSTCSACLLTLSSDEVGTVNKSFLIALDDFNVPRFTDNQIFDVMAKATEDGIESARAPLSKRTTVIPLLVVLVPGIQPLCLFAEHCDGDDGTYSGLEDALIRQSSQKLFVNSLLGESYALRGTSAYPTLYTLRYRTNHASFSEGAQNLLGLIESQVRTLTYADKVNLVTHSKGGLVARYFVSVFPEALSRVNQLIMCAPPNLGSLWARLDNIPIFTGDYHNLYPLWKWRRQTIDDPYFSPEGNPELASLNNAQLPSGIGYIIFYSSSVRTETTFTEESNHVDYSDGDGVVPSFSALGKQYDPNDPFTRGQLILAFRRNKPYPVEIDGPHHGYLDTPELQTSIFNELLSVAQTTSGENLTVQLGAASLTFSTVITAGTTTVTPIDPSAVLPSGYSSLGKAVDITTTATYSGPITACLKVFSVTDESVFSRLRLLHRENGVLVDRTTSQDFNTKSVCATVNSLSPFVLAVLNSTPVISSINKSSSNAGDQQFTLTVNGTGFLNSATVQWNGSDRATTFVNETQLKAEIPASDIAGAGVSNITVVNPDPGGRHLKFAAVHRHVKY